MGQWLEVPVKTHHGDQSLCRTRMSHQRPKTFETHWRPERFGANNTVLVVVSGPCTGLHQFLMIPMINGFLRQAILGGHLTGTGRSAPVGGCTSCFGFSNPIGKVEALERLHKWIGTGIGAILVLLVGTGKKGVFLALLGTSGVMETADAESAQLVMLSHWGDCDQ